ncbi:MAG: hypothetical protein ACLQVY_12130 [Limisphaerales bacterium]
MNTNELIRGMPGEALLRKGLDDDHCGRRTVAACIVGIAWTRLSDAGLLPEAPAPPPKTCGASW